MAYIRIFGASLQILIISALPRPVPQDVIVQIVMPPVKLAAEFWQEKKLNVDTISGGHTRVIHTVAFSPNSQTIASGSGDKTIKVWSLNQKKLAYTLSGHSNWVNSVAFSPDGKILASGSGDRTLKLWNLQNGRLIRTISGHSDWVAR